MSNKRANALKLHLRFMRKEVQEMDQALVDMLDVMDDSLEGQELYAQVMKHAHQVDRKAHSITRIIKKFSKNNQVFEGHWEHIQFIYENQSRIHAIKEHHHHSPSNTLRTSKEHVDEKAEEQGWNEYKIS